MTIELTLPGTPITKKNHQQIMRNRSTGKPFISQSERYKQYEADCIWQIPKQCKLNIDRPCHVTTVFFMPDRRRVDVSNLVSACHDILVAAQVIKDDSSGIVARLTAWCEVDKAHPRVEIRIEVME